MIDIEMLGYGQAMKRISVRRLRVALAGLVAAVALLPASAHGAVAFGLGGEWRLDEGIGFVVGDSSGAGRDGLLGTGSATPRWVDGIDGLALRFDGDDEVRMPDSAGLEPARITVEAWVRNTGTPGTYRYVVSKGATACETSSYGLYTGTSRGLAFYIAGPTGYVLSAQAPIDAVWDGQWHHAAGVYDGVRVRLFLDGAEVGGGRPAPSSIRYGLPSKNVLLGTYRGGCDLPFIGDIDAVRIWDLALTPAEIATARAQPQERPALDPDQPRPGTPGPDSSPPPAQPVVGAERRLSIAPWCPTLVPSTRRVRVGRRTLLTATVRARGRGAARVRVALTGEGIRRSVRRTDRSGRARFAVYSPRKRTLRLSALDAPRSCRTAVARVDVR